MCLSQLVVWAIAPISSFQINVNILDEEKEQQKKRLKQACSFVKESLRPVSFVSPCNAAGSSPLTFCPFFGGICMTEARRGACCRGNGLPPFAVGAERLQEELETVASEIRRTQRVNICQCQSSGVHYWHQKELESLNNISDATLEGSFLKCYTCIRINFKPI